jgi:anti-sigma regulatory factor (Ser/Thr protein kinase)
MVDKGTRRGPGRPDISPHPKSTARKEGGTVAEFILGAVEEHPVDLVRFAAVRFGVSRQAIHRVVRRLIAQRSIQASGQTRGRRYELGPLREMVEELEVTPHLDEARVWTETVRPRLSGAPENVLAICQYGFTEMLNNVVDHSGSRTAVITVRKAPRGIELKIRDEGIGIFRKIQTERGLANEHEAILELTKGKLTTDPAHHTGEGIFFTSRMFDGFIIRSGTVALACAEGRGDWSFEEQEPTVGTSVDMAIDLTAKRTTQEVFDRFASAEGDFSFDRTHLVVRLVEPEGPTLVSRSQAKRVLARLEKFREVVLDFSGVESVTPAFADEIFRVFASRHPEVHLMPVHDNEQVRRMIRRAGGGRGESTKPGA